MACVLNPAFWVYIIILIGGIMIARKVIPWFISFFEIPEPVSGIIMIVLWIVVACAGVYLLFEIFGCIFGSGLSLPSLPTRR